MKKNIKKCCKKPRFKIHDKAKFSNVHFVYIFYTFFYLEQLMLFLVAFIRTNTGAFTGLIESLI